MQSRDRRQAQMSMSRLNSTYFGNHHRGCGGRSFADAPKKKLFDLPQITWKCPPKFLLNPCWRVAAGEDSEEAKTQKLREARMLDTAHPYPYDTCSFDAPAHLSDCQVPLIPLIPVEEKEEEALESDMVVPEDPSFKSPPQVPSPRNPMSPENDPSDSPPPAPSNDPAAGADVVAAAAAVMTAIMKSKEEGSLIDTELLIKLLSDPQMVQNLMDCHEDIAKMSTALPVSGPCPVQKPGTVEEEVSIESKPVREVTNDRGLMGELKPVVVPNPNPDPRFENSTRKLEVVTAPPSSGPYHPPTSRASIPIPRPNPVSENFTYGRGPNGSVPVATSQKPPPSFPSPNTQVSGPYPVPSRASLPTPRPNPVVENFTYGHNHHINGPVPVGKSQPPLPSFPSPKPQVSSPHLNLLPSVSLHRFPSPSLGGDTGFQLEPFSPNSRSPGAQGSSFLHLPAAKPSLLHLPSSVGTPSVSVKPAGPPVKDTSYFKDLIRKHGETVGPESGKLQVSSLDLQLLSTLKRDQPAQKSPRPCAYFNSPRGCRNGSKCSFRHEVEAPDAKRIKLSR